MIYLLTAVGLTPSGSSTVHIYKQTIRRTTHSTQTVHKTTQLIVGSNLTGGYGCLSVVSVVCCQVELSAKS